MLILSEYFINNILNENFLKLIDFPLNMYIIHKLGKLSSNYSKRTIHKLLKENYF